MFEKVLKIENFLYDFLTELLRKRVTVYILCIKIRIRGLSLKFLCQKRKKKKRVLKNKIQQKTSKKLENRALKYIMGGNINKPSYYIS